jgi:hypothetical protein
MGERERYLGVGAGPFRLALPLETVRQILDVGGAQAVAPADPRALGVEPISLARLLGAAPSALRPALLLFDGHTGPALLSTCLLGGVIDADEPPRPLPRTVACRWPGLIRGVIEDDVDHLGLRLVLDPRVLMGLVEAHDAAPRAVQPPAEPGRGP